MASEVLNMLYHSSEDIRGKKKSLRSPESVISNRAVRKENELVGVKVWRGAEGG